jgi:hypothetical protein
MRFLLKPWHILVLVLAAFLNRELQRIIEYLRTENQVLREKLGGKRILLSDGQRRRLAVKGKVLGRRLLSEIGTLVTPDTLLRWHRQLIAQKWDFSDRRTKTVGRPSVSEEVSQLVVRMARENPTWGYDRIQGALANLGYALSDQTVGNILKDHGIAPVPERKQQTTWKTFLRAHWDVLAAIDFTTIEVWTPGGLVTYYLLFVMEVGRRRVHFAGCTTNPGEVWMKQIARNLTDAEGGFLLGNPYLLMDRDSKFCESFRHILEQADVKCVRLPPKSPNLSPHIERFMRSIKEESLSRLILFGEKSLRKSIYSFLEHYHGERSAPGTSTTWSTTASI